MTDSEILTLVLSSLAAFLVFSGIFIIILTGYIIFKVLLVRTKPEKWGHECSMPNDPEISSIFNTGAKWREEHSNVRKDIYIKNDGFKLYGEYFDFGYDRAVIIIAGRMECCIYSCYFAEPYRKSGYNILVIDGRAHGFSEGKYNSIGQKEYRDLIAWGKMLHDDMGVKNIYLHGVCIGASTSLFAITDESCPDYFSGITVEGMYVNFYESTKNHMKKDKRPVFPFIYIVMFFIRIFTGVHPMKDGPYKRISKLKKPILFLHGKQDVYSLPEKAEELYASCNSEKQLVWFDEGGHSRLRINNTEKYDAAITEFFEHLVKKQAQE